MTGRRSGRPAVLRATAGLTLRGALVLSAFAVALVTSGAQSDAASAVTASSLIKATASAIAEEGSVHVLFLAQSGSSSKTEKIVADGGMTSGKEVATEGKNEVTIELIAKYVYVSGNFGGLTTLFGMSSADARKVGHGWESWKSGTSQYGKLASDVKISSVVALLPSAKGTRLSHAVVDGTSYDTLKWTIAATSSTPQLTNVLTVSTASTSLPVEETTTGPNGIKVTTTLSQWGEVVPVTAPSQASTISS